MSRNKKSSALSTKKKGTVEIDPSLVRFTHARIRPYFTGCGKKIDDTIQEIVDGVTLITDLPLISVIENEGNYFSLNNRRLYTIKHIQSLGLLPNNTISVYLKPALEREKKRYIVERCALHAKIMLEHEKHHEKTEEEQNECSDTSEHEKEIIKKESENIIHKNENTEDITMQLNTIQISTKKDKKSKQKSQQNMEVPSTENIVKPMKTSSNQLVLPIEVTKELKELTKLVNKGKKKAVLSQIDEWEILGLITEVQRDFICQTIGI